MSTQHTNANWSMDGFKAGRLIGWLSSLFALCHPPFILPALLAAGMMLTGTAQGQSAQATGGDITNTVIGSDGYYWKVHTFASSGSFNVSVGGTGVEYLVIGGGGGGGWGDGGFYASGGGAGGYRSSCSAPGELSGSNSPPESRLTVEAGSNYTVTVGAGGAGSTSSGNPGNNGSNSVFGPIIALGGGGGARATAGQTGGCGGGGQPAGSGTAGQGFDGGVNGGGWREKGNCLGRTDRLTTTVDAATHSTRNPWSSPVIVNRF